MVRWTGDDMLVNVGQWEKAGHNGADVDVLAVQFERLGFTLSLHQAREFCGKLKRLGSRAEFPTEEGDALFVDLDRTTRDTPFVILRFVAEGGHPRWFCDIPEPAARELYEKLTERLRERKGVPEGDATVAGSRQRTGRVG